MYILYIVYYTYISIYCISYIYIVYIVYIDYMYILYYAHIISYIIYDIYIQLDLFRSMFPFQAARCAQLFRQLGHRLQVRVRRGRRLRVAVELHQGAGEETKAW